MARMWHAPSYHIVKGFFTPKGPQFELNQWFLKVLGGHKVAKILYIAIYSPIFTMVEPYIHMMTSAAVLPTSQLP